MSPVSLSHERCDEHLLQATSPAEERARAPDPDQTTPTTRPARWLAVAAAGCRGGGEVSRRTYTADPDQLDPDRGSSSLRSKQATFVAAQAFDDRAATRAGARDLDVMVEAAPGLTRAARDRERATPRDVTTPVRHPALERSLGEPDGIRLPLSSRQRKARSVTKRQVQARLPATQYRAVQEVFADESAWRRLNDQLSEAVGDAQALDDRDRVSVQRLDRAVAAYERANDRGHLLYANVALPLGTGHNLEGFTRRHFPEGRVVELDRFTGCAHTLHQLEDASTAGERPVVFEMATRRGAYLGTSDSVDNTTHLLPRGMRLRVVSVHSARYRRPDGTEGRQQVVQLVDADQTDQATS